MAKGAQELQFKVLIEQDEDGIYVASVPELPGCYTQGKTVEEVRKRIKEAIKLVLESDKDVNDETNQASCTRPSGTFVIGGGPTPTPAPNAHWGGITNEFLWYN